MDFTKEVTALLLCDIQSDLLGSIQNHERLLSSLKVIVEVARLNNWVIVYSGLKFKAGYEGLSPKHKLYGALRRLNDKLGDKAVHWFMEGWDGSDILSTDSSVSPRHNDHVVWRSQHMPYELATFLQDKGVGKVFVTGAKASGSVQISCQLLMDRGMDVTIVKECVQDDDKERLNATFEHILPLYGHVTVLREVVDDAGGLGLLSAQSKNLLVELASEGISSTFYASNCGRRGHGSRFIKLLQERGGWDIYPTQIWYEDFVKGEFYCPLAKKVVDFCDEPEFSKVAMYLLGRENLDEKDKLIEIAGRFMPKTFCIEEKNWVGEEPPGDDEEGALSTPWFVKEADKNLGGDAILIMRKPSEIMDKICKNKKYVVQQHIRDPLLTDDGRKTHLKFYVLLVCEEDGITWTLYTYKGALLSISPNLWSRDDLSHETQVTIHRHPVPPNETKGWKQHWESVYEKCKRGTAEVISNAISQGKLKGRTKRQFEVFSVDWMPDEHGNIWMFEFNMSPAVAQSEFDDINSRDDRRQYLMRHDEIMLREALAIVFPLEGNESPGQWDFAGKFKS